MEAQKYQSVKQNRFRNREQLSNGVNKGKGTLDIMSKASGRNWKLEIIYLFLISNFQFQRSANGYNISI